MQLGFLSVALVCPSCRYCLLWTVLGVARVKLVKRKDTQSYGVGEGNDVRLGVALGTKEATANGVICASHLLPHFVLGFFGGQGLSEACCRRDCSCQSGG